MSAIPFDKKELEVTARVPNFFGGMNPVYNFPVTMKEGYKAAVYDKKPIWLPSDIEQTTFTPSIIPDNVARGFCFEGGEPLAREFFGGKDMFGVEWIFIDVAGGSMVKPGNPMLEDCNDWKEKIVFPDIDSWDWEGTAAKNKEYLANNRCNILTFLNGCWFERLISFMDFEEAAVAMIDEDQRDAVKELMHECTTLYMKLVDKCLEVYDLDGFEIHDDWGSQMAPFFSEESAREIILPEMKRFVDYVHSKGKICNLHSCGHIESRIEIFVEAGFDCWIPMPMNDTADLYEKYGDKICIGIVNPEPFNAATATEEEQRAAARKFAERFCKPGKTACWSAFYNAPDQMTEAFREELYIASRELFAK